MHNTNQNQLLGCFIGGMIGDAGAIFENNVPDNQGDIAITHSHWQTTDDTQLTLAMLESIVEHKGVFPEKIAQRFLAWFQQKRLVGLGSATLQALQGLQVGGHWALVGRSGEFAAGNGAAMRIAPLAFIVDPVWDRVLIKDVCNITHKNDEAYVGALAVLLTIHFISADLWTDNAALWDYLIQELPDTKVRDALMLAKQFPEMSIELFAANFGNSGYVVETVPLALFAAIKVKDIGFETMLQAIIQAGGDTDTIASITGQVAGTWLGLNGLPQSLLAKANEMKEYEMFEELVKNLE
ncbi:hypothetical protein BKI52_06695 [marine bacterium AO1-C]|nr:hypothetical protein BKI52_06695 [marine bacterium AO1-C]